MVGLVFSLEYIVVAVPYTSFITITIIACYFLDKLSFTWLIFSIIILMSHVQKLLFAIIIIIIRGRITTRRTSLLLKNPFSLMILS